MESDERQIRQLVATWMMATKAGDIETVLNLMTDDVVFLQSGRPPMVGKSSFEAAAGPSDQEPPRFDGTSEIQEIKIFGEWAFMWTKLSVVVSQPSGAPPITRAGHTLSILRKEHGKWLLARNANMLSPVQESDA